MSERDVETEINTERTGDGEALESGRNVNLDTSSSSNFHTKEGSGVWKCSDIHFSRPAMSSDIQSPEIPPFQAAPACYVRQQRLPHMQQIIPTSPEQRHPQTDDREEVKKKKERRIIAVESHLTTNDLTFYRAGAVVGI